MYKYTLAAKSSATGKRSSNNTDEASLTHFIGHMNALC